MTSIYRMFLLKRLLTDLRAKIKSFVNLVRRIKWFLVLWVPLSSICLIARHFIGSWKTHDPDRYEYSVVFD